MSLLKRRVKTNVKQKSRKVKIHSKKNLVFGTCGIILLRQLYLENIHYKFIRLMLRKRRRGKKRRFRFGYQRYWVRCGKNIFFSKKSKNSRMGSGKGNFVRKATRVGVSKTLLEFKYRRHGSLFGLLKALRHRIKIFARPVFKRKALNSVITEGNFSLQTLKTTNLDLRLIK